MKNLLVLMLAILTVLTSPEQFKMNSICPHQNRLCFYTDVLPGVEIVPYRPRQHLLKPRCTRTVFFYACPA